MKKKEKISESIRLRGWKKFFHGLFLFVTFPIRKPLIFVPILMFGYLAPTFMGAKPTEVHLWYWHKIKSQGYDIGTSISEKTQKILPDVDKLKITIPELKNISRSTLDTDESDEETDLTPKQIRRQIFEKSKETPNTIDALRTAQLQEEKMLRQNKEPTKNISQDENNQKKLPLVYINNEEKISGRAEVVNANELNFSGKTYFLHGIYVDPSSETGVEAKQYLQSIIAQNIITCQIKAYTYQGVGTIICFVNGENINWLLVKRGYSQNIDLEK